MALLTFNLVRDKERERKRVREKRKCTANIIYHYVTKFIFCAMTMIKNLFNELIMMFLIYFFCIYVDILLERAAQSTQ